MTDYKISEKQCAEGISGVCSKCGGEITPIETVDNSGAPTFWSGCKKCWCFDNGVTHKVYKIAEKLVSDGYSHYSHLLETMKDTEEELLYKKHQQIGGACGLVMKVIKIYEDDKINQPHQH